MQYALITYTITPCPLCGVDMPGQGTVTRNGSDLWTGWIGCTSCDYAVSGEGNTEFFAATATASKHKAALKKIKRHLCMLADALEAINGKAS